METKEEIKAKYEAQVEAQWAEDIHNARQNLFYKKIAWISDLRAEFPEAEWRDELAADMDVILGGETFTLMVRKLKRSGGREIIELHPLNGELPIRNKHHLIRYWERQEEREKAEAAKKEKREKSLFWKFIQLFKS